MAYLLEPQAASLPKLENNFIGVAVGGSLAFDEEQLTRYLAGQCFRSYRSETPQRKYEITFLATDRGLGRQLNDAISLIDLFTPQGEDAPPGMQVDQEQFYMLRNCARVVNILTQLAQEYDFKCDNDDEYEHLQADLQTLSRYSRITAVNLMIQASTSITRQYLHDEFVNEQKSRFIPQQRLAYDQALAETFHSLLEQKEPYKSIDTDDISSQIVREAVPQPENMPDDEWYKKARVWFAQQLTNSDLFLDLNEGQFTLPITAPFRDICTWDANKLAEELSDGVLLFIYQLCINYRNR